MENTFDFIWKFFSFLTIFFSNFFGHVGKQLDKKTKLYFKIYHVMAWETNNYNRHIAQFKFSKLFLGLMKHETHFTSITKDKFLSQNSTKYVTWHIVPGSLFSKNSL